MWHQLTSFQRNLLLAMKEKDPETDVVIEKGGKGIRLERCEKGWMIQLSEERFLGRAAMLIQANESKPLGWVLEETPGYEKLGAMLDCSRNAVPRVETVKRFLRILCRMGYSVLHLYLEDVYELEDYPYFGYGRGRYTTQELRELDEFASSLGIELVPSIQTLAHLGQFLKWPAMKKLVDCNDILLIDEPETYSLIRAMFAQMRRCFSTSRINIGMDEAHMVGLGKYLALHGYEDRTKLMLRHFQKVHDIAAEFGFSSMMWSDMFFRLASAGDYYAEECSIDQGVAKLIPNDTTLIYWDYYSGQTEIYEKMLTRHRQLSENIMFAAGAWKWSGFAPSNQFSINLAKSAHRACKKHHVKEVLVTLWGDNGAECSPFSVLPVLHEWAELFWKDGNDQSWADHRFFCEVQGNRNNFMLLDELNFTPDNPSPGRCGVNGAANATKTFLYEDPLFPLFSPGLNLDGYASHLEQCVVQLSQAVAQEAIWTDLFSSYLALAKLLLQKAQMQNSLQCGWKGKNVEMLAEAAGKGLEKTTKALQKFVKAYHAQWLQENKAAGLDVFDLRIGGQLQRLVTAGERLNDYLSGKLETLEELDEPWLAFDVQEWEKGHHDMPAPFWHQIVSPSGIATI